MRHITNIVASAVIMAGVALLGATPVAAAAPRLACAITDVISIIDTLCPNGGRATNITQTAAGCTFDLTCA